MSAVIECDVCGTTTCPRDFNTIEQDLFDRGWQSGGPGQRLGGRILLEGGRDWPERGPDLCPECRIQ